MTSMTPCRPMSARQLAVRAVVLCLMPWLLYSAESLAADNLRPPNVILILMDDMGWRDVGFMGNRFVETPHIDRLAKNGLVFTQAYASAPNCAPTRACLMSGQYTPRHGIYTVVDPRQPPGSPWQHARSICRLSYWSRRFAPLSTSNRSRVIGKSKSLGRRRLRAQLR